MLYYKLVLISAISFGNQLATGQVPILDSVLTPQRCIELALQNNFEIKKSETIVLQNTIALQQAKTNLLPTIGTNGSYSISYGRGMTRTGITINAAQSKVLSLSANTNFLISNGLILVNNIR